MGIGTFTSEFFEESWPQEVLKAEATAYRLIHTMVIPWSFQSDSKINFTKQPMG